MDDFPDFVGGERNEEMRWNLCELHQHPYTLAPKYLGSSETENSTRERDPKLCHDLCSPVHTRLAALHILDNIVLKHMWDKADSVLEKCSWWEKARKESKSETCPTPAQSLDFSNLAIRSIQPWCLSFLPLSVLRVLVKWLSS